MLKGIVMHPRRIRDYFERTIPLSGISVMRPSPGSRFLLPVFMKSKEEGCRVNGGVIWL